MKKMVALAICSLLTVTSVLAQATPEDSVKTAVGKFYSAMRSSDGLSLRLLFTDSATYQNINKDKYGEPVVRATSVVDLALLIGRTPRGAADTRIISFDIVKTSGPLATVWVTYHFYVNGQFSHCGNASFQLIRINGSWRVQYYIDTQRRVNCTP